MVGCGGRGAGRARRRRRGRRATTRGPPRRYARVDGVGRPPPCTPRSDAAPAAGARCFPLRLRQTQCSSTSVVSYVVAAGDATPSLRYTAVLSPQFERNIYITFKLHSGNRQSRLRTFTYRTSAECDI
ncbi:hypothetical protein EVAR_28277_1 [Eumeta japonica]|uniref:Uncharacterized protein n=1 Tax=Eumeta variegata TaxID=151549 RepID=A0A4C1V963_EUMVA|nr:hypothetical protein EVAR_28277_1 [Eumeta japonica]